MPPNATPAKLFDTIRRWPGILKRSGQTDGALLRRIALDLPQFDWEMTAPGECEFRPRSTGDGFSVREILEAHFMMRIVSAEFIVRCPVPAHAHAAAPTPGAALAVHRGRLRRSGVEYLAAGAECESTRTLCTRLARSSRLTRALIPLDFTHCRFAWNSGWAEMRLRHFGACEIVGQMPKFRRYVRLGPQQRESLIECFAGFREIVRG